MTTAATPPILPLDGPIIIRFRATGEACTVRYCNFTGNLARRVSVS